MYCIDTLLESINYNMYCILLRIRTIRKGLHNTNRPTLTQVTYDHSLSCLHQLNTSVFQTRLVNERKPQKRLHNPNRTIFIVRQQPKPLGWMKTRLCNMWFWDESSFPRLDFRWKCIIQRHNTRSYLVYYITQKH
jgi:hypothetical protein